VSSCVPLQTGSLPDLAMGKSESAEVRDARVTTGKKREIKREVSGFLPVYDVID